MDLGLAGRRAIVTGASKGIGLAATRSLIAEGVDVVAGSRDTSQELDELANQGHARAVNVDLSTAGGPGELVAAALEAGPVDILVNNAGAVTPRVNGFLTVTDEQWMQSINLTLMAAVRTTRALLPHLVAAGRGSIVNTASVNARLPDPLVIDYSAAKAALINFSKALSKQVGPSGVRVNTVSPGPVSTALWLGHGGVAETVAGANDGTPESIARQAVRDTATGRFTEPGEVADLIVFLTSDRAANITGTDYLIDGGLIHTIP
jgi:NAD(P)-dependent dehydrogenase (short-subunit alcohol dehydrogenase family)